jgi:hypothetical protein
MKIYTNVDQDSCKHVYKMVGGGSCWRCIICGKWQEG